MDDCGGFRYLLMFVEFGKIHILSQIVSTIQTLNHRKPKNTPVNKHSWLKNGRISY